MPARHKTPRRQSSRSRTAQAGVLLLEAFVAILIFSLGVLAIIQLQAVSIKQASAAQYRSEAALLANDLISRMWASDKTAATLQANFQSGSQAGAAYNQWLATVQASSLPNVNAASNTLPTVTFVSVPAGAGGTASSLATVTIFWQGPGEPAAHNYTTVAQLK